jgi:hypothetical protein
VPEAWIGTDHRRIEGFKKRLPEWVSELTPLDLLKAWRVENSTLRRQDKRARSIPEKTTLGFQITDAGFQCLEFVAAAVMRTPEDILVAMTGEIEESFATWEKVEAAKRLAVLPARPVARKPATIAETRCDPILPGDKVVFVKREMPRELAVQFTGQPWLGRWEKQAGKMSLRPTVQSVRQTSLDHVTGEQMIHLVGCYGVSSSSNQEPGFPARLLRKVSESRGVIQLTDGDLVQVSVETSARIARQLEGFQLFPHVETIHEWETDQQFEVVCRRWVNRKHQSKPIRDALAAVRAEIADSGAVTLQVPISALGWQNLDRVCRRLDIAPADWLQGVLHNLAVRVTTMRKTHEVALRKAGKG